MANNTRSAAPRTRKTRLHSDSGELAFIKNDNGTSLVCVVGHKSPKTKAIVRVVRDAKGSIWVNKYSKRSGKTTGFPLDRIEIGAAAKNADGTTDLLKLAGIVAQFDFVNLKA